MQLWNFEKCKEMAAENSATGSEGFLRISRLRMARICTAAVLAVVLVAIVVLAVMHSEEKEWDEVKTHELKQFVITAEDCVEYDMDMTEGEYVKDELVMPVKSFTIGDQGKYYVYLDNSGNEGIFHFADEMSAEVEAWLGAWEKLTDEMPEPVVITGAREVLSISGDAEALAEYDGRSYIEAGEIVVERDVPIEGAEEELARVEAEKKRFEERREELFAVMCVVLVLFAVVLAAQIIERYFYDRARRAFMAEISEQD